jgi:hypothetical protein
MVDAEGADLKEGMVDLIKREVYRALNNLSEQFSDLAEHGDTRKVAEQLPLWNKELLGVAFEKMFPYIEMWRKSRSAPATADEVTYRVKLLLAVELPGGTIAGPSLIEKLVTDRLENHNEEAKILIRDLKVDALLAEEDPDDASQ